MNYSPGVGEYTDSLKDHYLAIILILFSLLAALVITWQMYQSRSILNWAEKSAVLNTFMIFDVIIFTISVAAALLSLYIGSLLYGDYPAIRYHNLIAYIICMLAPILFIGGSIVLKPAMLAGICVEIAALMSVLSIIASFFCILYAMQIQKPAARIRQLFAAIFAEHLQEGENGPSDILQHPYVSSSNLSLMAILKKLAKSGDHEPVKYAIRRMSEIAVELGTADDTRRITLAKSMVASLVEAGSISAECNSPDLIRQVLGGLKNITVQSPLEIITTMSFRGIGYVYGACIRQNSAFKVATLNPWLAGIYVEIYDSTGRLHSLDRATVMADGALAEKDTMVLEDRARALYAAGQVYRRVAEVRKSEERATIAISHLEQALKIEAIGPLDYALVNAELGRAHTILGSIKNAVKSYKKALSCYEDAGKTLTPAVTQWGAALLKSDEGRVNALLADEYYRLKKYEESLASARSAIECFAVSAKFFTPARSKKLHERIMTNAGLSHTVISEIYLRSRDLDNALKHVYMSLDCYSASLAMIDAARAPEAQASLKVSIGLAYVSVAEICFKEKRYEEAITACDRAIASYGESLKLYEGSGKDRLASQAKKYLKQASDLYNSFMMIGVGKVKRSGEAI